MVDGRQRNLGSRRYCLKCSPFGQHNTKNLESRETRDEIVICKGCEREYVYDRGAGHSKIYCNSCTVNRRRFRLKLKAIKYKGGKCIQCGYSKCPSALDFHHRNLEEKDFSLSSNWMRSWERIKKELDKCDLLCCRCHQELHYNLNGNRSKWQQQLEEYDGSPTKVGKTCPICKEGFEDFRSGNKIYCSSECSDLARRKVKRPNKKDLKEEIANNTWVALGRKYGVSDNTVRKWAKAYGIL